METKKQKQIKRYGIWAVFMLVSGMVAGYFVPEENLVHFYELLRDIMTNLIVG